MKFLLSIGLGLLLVSAREEYRAAHDAHPGNAVVLLVQDACAPCTRLENDLLPILRQVGMLEDSSITIISINKQPKLVRRLQGPGLNGRRGFPCLLVFRTKGKGIWAWRTFGYRGRPELLNWLRGINRWEPRSN